LDTEGSVTCPHCAATYASRDFRSKLELMDEQIGQFLERRLLRQTVDQDPRVVRCSFCGVLKEKGAKFISGPSEPHPIYICRACVELCVDVLESDGIRFKWSGKGT
jgi:hypothetical protein